MRALRLVLLLSVCTPPLALADVGQPKVDPRDEAFIESWDRLRQQYSMESEQNKKESQEIRDESAQRAREA